MPSFLVNKDEYINEQYRFPPKLTKCVPVGDLAAQGREQKVHKKIFYPQHFVHGKCAAFNGHTVTCGERLYWHALDIVYRFTIKRAK